MWVLFDVASIAFVLALLLSPPIRDGARRLGWVDRPGARKVHRQPVPRVGGIAIAISYAAALGFLFVAPYKNLPVDLPAAIQAGVALLPAAVLILAVGFVDDVVGIKPWQKFAGQTVAAVLAFQAGFGIYVFRGDPLEVWISLPVTVLWLVACSNAVNLIDGIDGLAVGVGFFASAVTLIAALLHGNLPLALVTAPLAGALLGFLRYNFNPASLFLGDSGSLLVGFLLGCYSALWSHKSATLLGMTAPLMALAIPLLDTGLAIVRRLLTGRPIFGADRRHIHHRLLDQGLTQRRAVLVLYGVCGLAAMFSLLQDVVNESYGGLIIILFCASAWIGVQHLGYAELGVASRLLFRGQLRGTIDLQLRLQEFERQLGTARSTAELWPILWHGCQEFGFDGARLRVTGRIFESPSLTDRRTAYWQLRLPLSDERYLNLYRKPDSAAHPMTLNSFGETVTTLLNELLPRIDRKEPSPGEPSDAAQRSYSASA
jgi:UDP-GlcNAc:undecaprenyl-phosphate/decaprenyl-phosphate GlcNAc-1-phosphate transferase